MTTAAARAAFAVLAALAATPAFAHPGHFAESGGHSHWAALAVLWVGFAVGLVAILRSRRARAARKSAERRA